MPELAELGVNFGDALVQFLRDFDSGDLAERARSPQFVLRAQKLDEFICGAWRAISLQYGYERVQRAEVGRSEKFRIGKPQVEIFRDERKLQSGQMLFGAVASEQFFDQFARSRFAHRGGEADDRRRTFGQGRQLALDLAERATRGQSLRRRRTCENIFVGQCPDQKINGLRMAGFAERGASRRTNLGIGIGDQIDCGVGRRGEKLGDATSRRRERFAPCAQSFGDPSSLDLALRVGSDDKTGAQSFILFVPMSRRADVNR